MKFEDVLWDNTFLPLFKCKIGKFRLIIKFADQLPRKKFKIVDRVDERIQYSQEKALSFKEG